MTRLRAYAFPSLVAAAVAMIATFVLWPEPKADWLQVSGPTEVIAGEAFIGTITLSQPHDGEMLDFDFHGMDEDGQSLGCLAVGGSQHITPAQHVYVFTLLLPSRSDLRKARGVIYTSTSGRWSDRKLVALPEPIPVVAPGAARRPPVLKALTVRNEDHDPGTTLVEPSWMRPAGTLLFLFAAIPAWRNWHRKDHARKLPAFALICLACALWEFTSPGAAVSDFARRIAREHHLYEDRRWVQQSATVAVVTLLGVLSVLGVRRARHRVPTAAIAGFCLYTTIVAASMLSLHEVDHVLTAQIAAVPVASWLRLAGMLGVLVGACTGLAWTPRALKR